MRWGRVRRAAFGLLGLLASAGWLNGLMAQEAGELDVDFDIDVVTLRPASLWSDLTDNRATRKRKLDWLSGREPDSTIYFAGIDASKWSFAGFTGAQWAQQGVNQDGFILRGYVSENLERYTDPGALSPNHYDTAISRAYVLPGYLFRIHQIELQLLAGPDAELDFVFQNGRPDRWRSRFGIRGIADIWWEPSQQWMLQASLTGTTIDNGHGARIAAGWRLDDAFWIGPEAAINTDFFSEQTRFGAHLTGLRTGDYEWAFAAGRVSDDLGRSGVYARLGVMLRPPRGPLFDN